MQTFTLNTIGQNAVREAVSGFDKRNLQADAYFADAEQEADEAFNDDRSAVIEVRAMHSASGNPQTIRLQREWFDATDEAE